MRDYHKVFKKWSACATEDLLQQDDAGARVEYAIRTGLPEDRARAIKMMDFMPYNVIAGLELLNEDNYDEELKLYETTLIPALLTSHLINVTEGQEVLAYFVDKVKNHADGLLKQVADLLHVLQVKVITRNSRQYLRLLSFRFTDFEIAYLNYVWLRRHTGTASLKKLEYNVLQALADSPDAFTEQQKIVIEECISFHGLETDNVLWTSHFDSITVTNNENWNYLYSLCRADKMSVKCIPVHPFLSSDTWKFQKLTYDEKLMFLDSDVAGLPHTLALEGMLDRVDFHEYMNTFNRKLPDDTFANLVHLHVIDLNDISSDNLHDYLTGLKTEEAVMYFLEHKEVQSLDLLRTSYWSYDLDVYKDFLSIENNKRLQSTVLDLAFDIGHDKYVAILVQMLENRKIVELYDKELIRSIFNELAETYKNTISSYKLNKIRENVLSPDELEAWKAEEREREAKESEERKIRKAEAKSREIKDAIDACTCYVELDYAFRELTSSRYYDESEILNAVYSKVVDTHDHWERDESYTRICYALWDNNVMSFEEFQKSVNSKEA